MDDLHQHRVKKITDLWLSGVLNSKISWEATNEADEEMWQEKEEIIDNVIQEMEDFWELE